MSAVAQPTAITPMTNSARTTGSGISDRLPGIGGLLLAQIRYQARLLAGGRTLVIGVGLPVILLIASTNGHARATASSVAGRAVFGLTLTAWNTYGIRLVVAREAGVLKRWRATPLPRWAYFVGRIVATVVVSMLAGAATVLVAVVLYNTHLSVASALAVLLVFVLGAAAWAACATAVASVIPTVEAASPIMILIYFPVVIISGVIGSMSQPQWLSTLASYLPAEPLVHGVTTALRHTAGTPLLSIHDLVVLAVWTLVGLLIAVAVFRWEPHHPTQRRPARIR